MKIKWNGHASFTITAADGSVIVTDPYEPGAFGGGIGYSAVDDRADVALVSHEHADHNHTKSLKGNPLVLKKGGQAKGIEFVSVETAHDNKGGQEKGKNMAFAFSVDGIRIGFLGDLGHMLSDAQLAQLGSLDMLLLPVGGFFTIDAGVAAKLAEKARPKVAIPMHYKTAKCAFPIATVDDFLKLMTRVKRTGQSEIEVSPKDLPAVGPEIWVMEFAR